jgi:hypothetical protein
MPTHHHRNIGWTYKKIWLHKNLVLSTFPSQGEAFFDQLEAKVNLNQTLSILP